VPEVELATWQHRKFHFKFDRLGYCQVNGDEILSLQSG